MVCNTEQYGILGDNMQGSRKIRGTMDVLTKRFYDSYNIARQRRSNQAIFDNDAASCYDQILVNLAMWLCMPLMDASRGRNGSFGDDLLVKQNTL